MRNIFWLGAAWLAMILVAATSATAAPPRPKLVVAISVDQFALNLFQRYRPTFTGGLKRLGDGLAFTGYQSHAATETCPGHSTILTGDHPAPHRHRRQQLVRPQDRLGGLLRLGGRHGRPDGARAGHAARGRPGRLAEAGEARRPVDRGLRQGPGGDHDGGPSPGRGLLVERRRGVRHLPLRRAGRRPHPGPGEGLRPGPVRRLAHAAAAAVADGHPGALRGPGASPTGSAPWPCPARSRPTRPGTSSRARPSWPASASPTSCAPRRSSTPMTLDFAAALVRADRLGRGPATDLLSISLSATDLVGHRYGNGGAETCMQLAALDAALGRFFDRLDRLGAPYVAVLTADHGAIDAPERLGPPAPADRHRRPDRGLERAPAHHLRARLRSAGGGTIRARSSSASPRPTTCVARPCSPTPWPG